jgi:hypothetical protein
MKEFILELDKSRKLVFDYDAWEKIKEKFNISADSQTDLFSKVKLSAEEIPYLAFAGLAWEDPGLTLEGTKKLLNESIRRGAYVLVDHMEIVIGALFYQQTGKEISIKAALEKLGPGKADFLDLKKKVTLRAPSSKKKES